MDWCTWTESARRRMLKWQRWTRSRANAAARSGAGWRSRGRRCWEWPLQPRGAVWPCGRRAATPAWGLQSGRPATRSCPCRTQTTLSRQRCPCLLTRRQRQRLAPPGLDDGAAAGRAARPASRAARWAATRGWSCCRGGSGVAPVRAVSRTSRETRRWKCPCCDHRQRQTRPRWQARMEMRWGREPPSRPPSHPRTGAVRTSVRCLVPAPARARQESRTRQQARRGQALGTRSRPPPLRHGPPRPLQLPAASAPARASGATAPSLRRRAAATRPAPRRPRT
mmetsp:Transcript_20631/g.66202  ORF Transcript_20631/g.66202 Transcript_20631/m.66202 type:complete len:281 (+) Transcript_20631:803-1645(+)